MGCLFLPADGVLLEGILPQLRKQFPRIGNVTLVASVEWDQAMPVVDEDFVDALRRNQGTMGFYYAGEYSFS